MKSLVGAARGGYLARLHHHGAGLGEGVVAVALVVPVRTCEGGPVACSMISCTVRLEWPGSTKMVVGGTNFLSLARIYRVIHLVGENLPLTQFRQFWQLVGHYCSYLLPWQDDGTSQI